MPRRRALPSIPAVVTVFLASWLAGTLSPAAEPPSPWHIEPSWLREPPPVVVPVDPELSRPSEPIPLPNAAVAGPVVVTFILAARALAKARRMARRR